METEAEGHKKALVQRYLGNCESELRMLVLVRDLLDSVGSIKSLPAQ